MTVKYIDDMRTKIQALTAEVESQAAYIKACKREIGTHRHLMNQRDKDIRIQAAELEAAKTEVERLRQDAELHFSVMADCNKQIAKQGRVLRLNATLAGQMTKTIQTLKEALEEVQAQFTHYAKDHGDDDILGLEGESDFTLGFDAGSESRQVRIDVLLTQIQTLKAALEKAIYDIKEDMSNFDKESPTRYYYDGIIKNLEQALKEVKK